MGRTEREQAIDEVIQADPFADRLGATVEVVAPGHSRATLTVTDDMLNFMGTTHGGVIFSLADIAFAAAGNSRGQTSVALNVSIYFLKASRMGDRLVAEAREIQDGRRTALYEITVRDAETGELVATTQDLVYRKRDWFVPPEE